MANSPSRKTDTVFYRFRAGKASRYLYPLAPEFARLRKREHGPDARLLFRYQFKEDALGEDRLGSNAHPQAQKMWSCSPSANVTCPDIDGFYDRRADPFQLNNIKERPEKAKELFDKLRLFMGELKTM